MLNPIKRRWGLVCAVALLSVDVMAQQPVIPGAAGFGMETPAGRGGKIIRVTSLDDKGPGTLRACVTASGPRICIFEVSGTIPLKKFLTVTNPFLTIAGQTAPAPGIMLRGAPLVISASNVLVQHLTVRAGDDPGGPPVHTRDALKINKNSNNVVIDHCSFSWALDENIETFKKWDNVTISNTIISQALATMRKGKPGHAYAALIHSTSDTSKISFIGNLFAHNDARNPRSNAAQFVFVNNVIYNPGDAAIMLFNHGGITSDNTIIGNVFIDGRNTTAGAKPIRLNGRGVYEAGGTNEILRGTRLYLADNVAPGATGDLWSIVDNQSPVDLNSVKLFSAPRLPEGLHPLPTGGDAVLDYVLANAGSRPGQRSEIDAEVVASVKAGTGFIPHCVSDNGTSHCAINAGGWPVLAENSRRLDVPSDPNDDDDGDGYTNLEEWLHGMAADVEGAGRPGDPDRPPAGQSSLPNPPRLPDKG
jgi:pectate lyase